MRAGRDLPLRVADVPTEVARHGISAARRELLEGTARRHRDTAPTGDLVGASEHAGRPDRAPDAANDPVPTSVTHPTPHLARGPVRRPGATTGVRDLATGADLRVQQAGVRAARRALGAHRDAP